MIENVIDWTLIETISCIVTGIITFNTLTINQGKLKLQSWYADFVTPTSPTHNSE